MSQPANLILPVLCITGLAVVGRMAWRAHCRPAVGERREALMQLAGQTARLAMLVAAVALVGCITDGMAAIAAAAFAGLVWAFCETLVMMVWKYFGIAPLAVARHMSIMTAEAGASRNALRVARAYLPVPTMALLGAGGAGTMAVCVLSSAVLPWLAAALAAGAVIAFALGSGASGGVAMREAELAFLALDDSLPTAPLLPADRSKSVIPRTGGEGTARHVLLIVNESAGDDVMCHGDIPLAEAIGAVSPDASEWLRAINPVTPSSCTDIALPCLLTGCGAEESPAHLHRLPLLFDLAKARGMTTLFYSASTLRWANFEAFFGLGNPARALDEMVTPESAGLPFANELGCDDHAVASLLCDRIRATPGPLFIVLYTYALHLPFQNDSPSVPIPGHITDRRARAAYLVEQAHRTVFDALRQAGHYDDTLVVSIGDHGEAFGEEEKRRGSAASRLTKLPDIVTRPMFVIKPPAGLDADRRACLERNMARLVSTIDIAPTIAGMLDLDLAGSDGANLAYRGFDLTREAIPEARVHYTLTVNQWRSWPLAGAMIAQGDMRLCVDYQTPDLLCCDGSGQPVPDDRLPVADALLRATMTQPTVRKVIARVFRDKLRKRGALPAERLVVAPPDVVRPAPVPGGYDAFFGHDTLGSDDPVGRLHYAGKAKGEAGFGIDQSDSGIILYGPYIALGKGEFVASLVFARGARMHPFIVDVCAAGRPDIARQRITGLADGQVAAIRFRLDTPATEVEVRLHTQGGFGGTCLGLFITETGAA